jgi:hypothetical protein
MEHFRVAFFGTKNNIDDNALCIGKIFWPLNIYSCMNKLKMLIMIVDLEHDCKISFC